MTPGEIIAGVWVASLVAIALVVVQDELRLRAEERRMERLRQVGDNAWRREEHLLPSGRRIVVLARSQTFESEWLEFVNRLPDGSEQ